MKGNDSHVCFLVVSQPVGLIKIWSLSGDFYWFMKKLRIFAECYSLRHTIFTIFDHITRFGEIWYVRYICVNLISSRSIVVGSKVRVME